MNFKEVKTMLSELIEEQESLRKNNLRELITTQGYDRAMEVVQNIAKLRSLDFPQVNFSEPKQEDKPVKEKRKGHGKVIWKD